MARDVRLGLGMLLSAAFAVAAGCGQGKVDPASCARWTAEVCKQAGKESDTCSNVDAMSVVVPPAACELALKDVAYLTAKLKERAQRCGVLETRACHDIGDKTRACKTVRQAARRFTPERCTAMLNDYATVLAGLRKQATARQLPAAQAAKLVAGSAPEFGPRDAKLQLVEFVDFENRDCVQAAAIVRDLRAQYGTQLHFVVRQFPLPYNAHASLAAEAALAAHAQGKFWELHDQLLANQHALDRAALDHYAQAAQLDMKQWKAALDRHTFAAAVQADLALGKELAVDGMPTLFVNGERMLNAVDKEGVVEAIEERLGG